MIINPYMVTSIGGGPAPAPTNTTLYDAGDNVLVSISTDIPANWNLDQATYPTATRLEIGTSCTTIGSNALKNCVNLTGNLSIPDSVTTIETQAFRKCEGLTGLLTIPDTLTSLGTYAFWDCDGFTSLAIGSGISTISQGAFRQCLGFTGLLNIPNTVTTIENYAFTNCVGFTSLVIPNSVTSIGAGAFADVVGAFTGLLGELYVDCPSANWIGTIALLGHPESMVIHVSPTYFGIGSNYDATWRSDQGVPAGATIVNWDNYPVAILN